MSRPPKRAELRPEPRPTDDPLLAAIEIAQELIDADRSAEACELVERYIGPALEVRARALAAEVRLAAFLPSLMVDPDGRRAS